MQYTQPQRECARTGVSIKHLHMYALVSMYPLKARERVLLSLYAIVGRRYLCCVLCASVVLCMVGETNVYTTRGLLPHACTHTPGIYSILHSFYCCTGTFILLTIIY